MVSATDSTTNDNKAQKLYFSRKATFSAIALSLWHGPEPPYGGKILLPS